jgi:CDP-6-deoxy-D-xylo-4-hexulose-3-dehydrase
MCRKGDRLELLTFLENNGVQTRVCFAGNITRHPVYREKYLKEFPVSDSIMSDAFLIGAHHGLTVEDADRVSDLLIEFYNTDKTENLCN